MVLIFDQDFRKHDGRRFSWTPGLYTGRWGPGRTWRVWWGLWSLSYFPEEGLRPFLDRVESGASRWES